MSDVVRALADRLAAPEEVKPWLTGPLSLSDGYPGLALVYGELSRAEPSYRAVAHAYLEQAVRAFAQQGDIALYDGPGALAFAAAVAARQPGDYAGLLASLDERIVGSLDARIRPESQRISAGRAGTAFPAYDVISGLTGVGRYLLARGRPELSSVLGYLCALTRPVTREDAEIPGWWVRHGPRRASAQEHFNLGMAHGIAGPLALLAVSWEQGVRVEGQSEAADRIVTWLLDVRGHDAHGPYWPGTSFEASRIRDAWCYGAPGVARALQLAGRSFGRTSWSEAAIEAMRGALRSAKGVSEPGLCHGRAGLLHLTWLIGRDAADAVLLEGAARLADRLVEAYDPSLRFGFRTDTGDRPGFLEGGAGIALALHAYSTGFVPRHGWDAALLVS